MNQYKVCILIGVIIAGLAGGIWWYNNCQAPKQEENIAATLIVPEKEIKEEVIKEEIPKAIQSQVVIEKEVQPKQVVEETRYVIIIDKSEYKLSLFKDDKIIKYWNVAVGAKPGQKQRSGDMTTPTGEFEVDEILDASSWTHDFGDGKGEIKNAYGPNFISLITGWDGIGIHGTHAPESIGTMASEGCIRLRNEELLELLPYVGVGTKVIIRE